MGNSPVSAASVLPRNRGARCASQCNSFSTQPQERREALSAMGRSQGPETS